VTSQSIKSIDLKTGKTTVTNVSGGTSGIGTAEGSHGGPWALRPRCGQAGPPCNACLCRAHFMGGMEQCGSSNTGSWRPCGATLPC
jgi:hypothetical protein